jgi:CO/xanthine dehydrogenase Mo-binding subunit
MNVSTDRLLVREIDGSRGAYPTQSAFVPKARAESLDVETVGPISLLPQGQKCEIRFEADATVTVMLGMRNYGHGYASPYFASLVAARLGIPVQRIRLYYAGVHPAVRVTPRQTPNVPSRASVGMANVGIGDLIGSLCDQAIEQGCRRMAHWLGVLPSEVDFEASSGRFFILGKERHVDILELAKWARDGGELMLN